MPMTAGLQGVYNKATLSSINMAWIVGLDDARHVIG